MGSHYLKIVFLGLFLMGNIASSTAASDPKKGQKPNHLLGAESPYLQQHIYNTVDWYPWGSEALDKAKIEGKPIFLSIGYSTCHWCHVMARESFDDEAVGKFLNENFVSVKIDRERRPDLDEQFMLVTQVISGGGGWPNSVFLTAEGKPFFAGTYFPKDAFLNILGQVDGLWRTQNADVNSEGVRIAGIIKNYMNRTQAARDLTPEAIRVAANAMVPLIDEFNGGFGVAPKFPQESTMLFLLDQAERDRDPKLMKIVKNALDGMIKGGIHDHVGGGFHRYSVDAEWHVPHFEKMLYNQAMIGRLLVRAWVATGELRYKHAAVRTFDYVLREMVDEKGGFYSAQDADSLSEGGEEGEGFFYVWTPEQIEEVLEKDATFALNALNITPDGNFEGTNVLHMIDLPADSAKENEITEEKYFTQLDNVFDQLHKARKLRTAPHKDRKIVVSWNAMMIETLAEAAQVFGRDDYYKAAKKAIAYVLDEMMNDNDLKRVSYEGSVAVDAQLPDYAGLGTALLAMYDYAPKGQDASAYLQSATKIADEIMIRFQNDGQPVGSAYKMTVSTEGIGNFLPKDDNEIPSGNALTLSLFAGLAKRLNDPSYNQKATLLAASLSAGALESAGSGGYTLLSAQALTQGEIRSVRFLADGAVRVATTIERNSGKLIFDIKVKEGWHINANKPLESYFIATELSVDGRKAGEEIYPNPQVKSLKFNAKPMALYEGEFSLTHALPINDENKIGQAILSLQACSDQICLLPEEVLVNIW